MSDIKETIILEEEKQREKQEQRLLEQEFKDDEYGGKKKRSTAKIKKGKGFAIRIKTTNLITSLKIAQKPKDAETYVLNEFNHPFETQEEAEKAAIERGGILADKIIARQEKDAAKKSKKEIARKQAQKRSRRTGRRRKQEKKEEKKEEKKK